MSKAFPSNKYYVEVLLHHFVVIRFWFHAQGLYVVYILK